MDTVDGIAKYWVGATWLPGKGPDEDYSLYRVHEVPQGDGSLGDYTERVYFTQIGIIHDFHLPGEESFTPQKSPWLDQGPKGWFIHHYERYGETESQRTLIALAELALC